MFSSMVMAALVRGMVDRSRIFERESEQDLRTTRSVLYCLGFHFLCAAHDLQAIFRVRFTSGQRPGRRVFIPQIEQRDSWFNKKIWRITAALSSSTSSPIWIEVSRDDLVAVRSIAFY